MIKVTVTPPHSGDALILVGRRISLWFTRTEVSAKGTEVEIPFQANWDSHDLYISAVVFRPGEAQEKITPNRAVGLIHLPLDREDRRLQVAIEAPEKVRPQGPTPLTVKLKLPEAPSGKTFVTLAAVDVGILNITDFETPDPFKWFFEPRRFNVDSYDMYAKVIELMDGSKAGLACGGGADVTPGGKRPENKIELVSLFSGPVVFNENGEAEVTLTVPGDFNGRVRLMAVAFNQDSFGSAESEVTIAAPLVTQIAMPRLLASGDEAEFTLDLHNLSGTDQEIELNLTASSPLVLTQGQRTVALKDKEKTTLRFPVSAENSFGTSTIHLEVQGQDLAIDREWSLGVRPGYPADTRRVRRVLQPGQTFTLDPALAQGLMPAGLETSFEISPVIPLNLREVASRLIGYPYGCLEQTTSQAWPPSVRHARKFRALPSAVHRPPGKNQATQRGH